MVMIIESKSNERILPPLQRDKKFISIHHPSIKYFNLTEIPILTKKFLMLILFSVFFQGCFEYEETIYFKKGFGGYVELSYLVPLNPRTGNSVLKFLPVTQEEIENRMNKGLFGKSLKIRDFSIKTIDKEDLQPNEYFSKKARVSYKIDFTDLSSLDGILLGNLFIKKKGSTIFLKREFKTILKTPDANSSMGEKKIRSETLRLLGDGFVLFRVIFPSSSECRSNLGEIGLGTLSYRLPLVETIEKAGNKIWDYSITTY